MIVTMQGSTPVGAASTIDNVLSGQRYERSPFPAAVGSLFCTGSALGLRAELNIGGVSITPPVEINAQDRFPVVPDDILVSGWEVGEGRLIQLSVSSTPALTFFWRIDLEEADIV